MRLKKTLSILLTLVMVVSLIPMAALPALAADGGTPWQILCGKLAEGGPVQLTEDVCATGDDLQYPLVVPFGKTVELDLNGHRIDANNDVTGFSEVITVKGTLTVKDSGTAQAGVITGGSDYGIEVYGGKLNLEGGTISGNGSYGVYVTSGTISNDYGIDILASSFYMTGGEIRGNSSYGVFLDGLYFINDEYKPNDDTTFTMDGGTISGNGSCGVYVFCSNFTMVDGEISGNEGSGVFVDAEKSLFSEKNGNHTNQYFTFPAAFGMYGGEISGNGGNGVYLHGGSFTMVNGEISDNEYDGVYAYGWFGSSSHYEYDNATYDYTHEEGLAAILMQGGEISGNGESGVDLYGGYSRGEEESNSSAVSFTMARGTICDNGPEEDDGYPGEYAGVTVRTNAEFTMDGGEISGNRPYGVCLSISGDELAADSEDDAVNAARCFTMDGGTVSDSLIGVYVALDGIFKMSGGTISGHEKTGVLVSDEMCAFVLSGGTISDNTCGVTVALVTVREAQLQGDDSSGGEDETAELKVKGFHLSGAPVFKDNKEADVNLSKATYTSAGNNERAVRTAPLALVTAPDVSADRLVRLATVVPETGETKEDGSGYPVIYIDDELKNTAPISVIVGEETDEAVLTGDDEEEAPIVFTSGLPGDGRTAFGSADNFSSADPNYHVELVEGEAALVEGGCNVYCHAPMSSWENGEKVFLFEPSASLPAGNNAPKRDYDDFLGWVDATDVFAAEYESEEAFSFALGVFLSEIGDDPDETNFITALPRYTNRDLHYWAVFTDHTDLILYPYGGVWAELDEWASEEEIEQNENGNLPKRVVLKSLTTVGDLPGGEDIEKEGLVLKGWALKDDADKTVLTQLPEETGEDVELVAVWEPEPSGVWVYMHPNGLVWDNAVIGISSYAENPEGYEKNQAGEFVGEFDRATLDGLIRQDCFIGNERILLGWAVTTEDFDPADATEENILEALPENDGEDLYLIAVWTEDSEDEPDDGNIYKVDIDTNIVHGKVSVKDGKTKFGPDEDVTLIVDPDSGYELDKLTVKDKDGKEVPLTPNNDGSYTFKIQSDVTVTASFKAKSSSGGSSGGYYGNKHTVKVSETENGEVTANKQKAYEGDKVKLSVFPEEGFELDQLTVKGNDGKTIEVKKDKEGNPFFLMPDQKVIVTATFKPIEGYQKQEQEPEPDRPFTDVPEGSWFYDAVYYCYDRGWFKGVSGSKFDPTGEISREMFITVLHRFCSEPQATVKNSFDDVLEDEWYTEAVDWGSQLGIILGYDNGLYGVGDPLTREQLVTIIWRWLGQPAGTGDLSGFKDEAKVSDWAREAMIWAVGEGIIQGKPGDLLDPQGLATRAEVAMILQKYDKAK